MFGKRHITFFAIAVAVLVSVLFSHQALAFTITDANWQTVGASAPDGSVYALTYSTSTNTLYAGGSFSVIGGVAASNIAKWNGTIWSALGSGTDGPVRSISLDASGNVYAGGDFTNVGGTAATYIAKWNGIAWSDMGGGADDVVRAVAADSSGNVYVGGDFLSMNSGGTLANRIVKWNGTAWSALTSGANDAVYSLAIDASNNLYVGGSFTTAGGVSARRVAKWNGTTWSALGTGSAAGTTHALAFSRTTNRLYAAGSFSVMGGVAANRVGYWDGSAWNAMATGVAATALSVAVDSLDNVYLGGVFSTASGVSANKIARWNGSAWSAVGSGTDDEVDALAVDASNNAYVGGIFLTAGGIGGLAAQYLAKVNAYYSLSYAAGSSGTLTGSVSQNVGSGDPGSAVTAVPNSGYHFVSWSDASTANPRTDASVSANLSVTASFAADPVVAPAASAPAVGFLPGGTSAASREANLRAIYAYNHLPYPGDQAEVSVPSFPRDLGVGMSGQDVKELQAFLNGHGFLVASSGPGSTGNETMVFGSLTRSTVIRFQNAYSVTPVTGYFGPKTRAAILKLLIEEDPKK